MVQAFLFRIFWAFVAIKSNERSEYSYIGLLKFFFCSRSILIFRGLTCDFTSSSVHFIVKRKANFSIERQNVEKRDRHLISKMKLFIRFPSEV